MYSPGDATIENCTIRADGYYAVYMTGGKLTLKDCVITGTGYFNNVIYSDNAGSTLTLCGKITIEGGINRTAGLIICLEGTYNFNPTQYVDTDVYSITDDGSGSYTVTAK